MGGVFGPVPLPGAEVPLFPPALPPPDLACAPEVGTMVMRAKSVRREAVRAEVMENPLSECVGCKKLWERAPLCESILLPSWIVQNSFSLLLREPSMARD